MELKRIVLVIAMAVALSALQSCVTVEYVPAHYDTWIEGDTIIYPDDSVTSFTLNTDSLQRHDCVGAGLYNDAANHCFNMPVHYAPCVFSSTCSRYLCVRFDREYFEVVQYNK